MSKPNASKSRKPKQSYERKNRGTNTGPIRKDAPKCDARIGDAIDNRESLDAIRSNNIAWYNRSPLYPLAVRVPFNQIMGTNTELRFSAMGYGYKVAEPGMMTIDFAPTIGWAADMNSAVNRAFNQLYADIVSRTTGALQMQQMDLAIMAIGISSIACHIGYAKKAMGVYQLYSSLNYYLPKNLISAMGFDFEDLKDKASNYQIIITDLINRFNALAIPDFSDVHRRQYGLAHNLYSDSETIFGQIINFRPYMIYNFDDSTHSLNPTTIWETAGSWKQIKFSAYLAFIRSALQLWENSSVTAIVAGNVRRAYPDSSLVHMDQFDKDAKVTPVVDRNILYQVNNMRWAPIIEKSLAITQQPDMNILLCKPAWDVSAIETTYDMQQACDMSYFQLNSFDGSSSDEFIMEATRLIPTLNLTVQSEFQGKTDKGYSLVDCPSELVARVTVFTAATAPDGQRVLQPITFDSSDRVLLPTDIFAKVSATTKMIGVLAKWRNGPGVLVHFMNAEGVPAEIDPIDSREINLYTHLHQDALSALHLAASQSLYWANGFVPGNKSVK